MKWPLLSEKRLIVILLAAILALSGWCLSPTLSNDYVNFDDTKYVVFNPAIKSLSRDSVAALFSTFSGQQYHYVPLTLLSYALEFRFHDLAPRIYHANNLFLHLLNTALCFWFVLLLFRDIKLAALVALLFGIHPMHVQSVAWISERKDVLYALFYLTGLVAYVKYVDARRGYLIVIVFVLFVFSLLSKPMAVTFPLIMLLIDHQRARRANAALFLEKVPFLLGSALIAAITLLPKDFPVVEFEKGFSWFERLLLASYTFSQYVVKAVYPQHLSAYHPLPARPEGILPLPFLVAPLIAVSLLVLAYLLSQRNARVAFGGLFFLASIALVLNLFPLGNILMAEHYTYLSYIGLFIIMAEVFFQALRTPQLSVSFRKVLIVSVACWAAVLVFKSHQRSYVWSNSETLWTDVLDKYPQEAFAYYNLADYYVRQEQFTRAIKEYTRAVEADPKYFSAYNNRGNMYFLLGRYEEAEADYRRAIAVNPSLRLAYVNLAQLYEAWGRPQEAVYILKTMDERR